MTLDPASLKGFSAQGMQTRKDIAGEDWFKVNMENMTEWDRYWQIQATNTNWAATWSRGTISQQDLSLITLAMLAGMGHFGEFEHHVRTAIERTHVPLERLREVFLHITQYCGMPTAAEIWKISRRVFKELEVDLSGLPPIDTSLIEDKG